MGNCSLVQDKAFGEVNFRSNSITIEGLASHLYIKNSELSIPITWALGLCRIWKQRNFPKNLSL